MWRASVGLAAATTGALAAYLTIRVLVAERAAQRPPVIVPEPRRTAAILVLGARVLPTGPSRELAARLDHAWSLWRAGAAPVVVVSGGVDAGLDETDVMRDYLEGRGIPAAAILEARPGGNTRQTLGAAARIAAERGLGPWIAVSSPYHARRLRDEGARRGLSTVASGPGDSPEMRNPSVHRVRLATEVVGTVLYALPAPVTDRLSRFVGRHRHSVPRLIARAPA
jgi:uncharacterized SAM-binding protein YcdF (DUF218 family)